MKTAQLGTTAAVHYTIKLADGQVVATSRTGKPLVFTIGKGQVLKGLDQGVIGMRIGESRTIEISPEDGYGPRDESLMITIDKSELPGNLAVGKTFQYMSAPGSMVNFIVSRLGEKTATIDANHPFAGQNLIFEVDLVAFPQTIIGGRRR